MFCFNPQFNLVLDDPRLLAGPVVSAGVIFIRYGLVMCIENVSLRSRHTFP